jgi:hypothetical protein
MRRPGTITLLVLALAWSVDDTGATGFYGPSVYLDQGGKNLDASPEFYWELEVKRLASEYHPAEKLIRPRIKAEAEDLRLVESRDTAEADDTDFSDALKRGTIKPADPVSATLQHDAARRVIAQTNNTTTLSLPNEFASEFADYHRGAFAFRRGQEHWAEARQAWEQLLQRPEQERHYRTVWSTFMIGKIALKSGHPTAAQWFRQTRELARAGFADSLGMAADSYGWEGRSEWKQGHSAKAAALFLTQLALGDESAIVSLKALIPDREPIEGMLNYGPEPDERSKWNAQQKRDQAQQEIVKLKRAVQDPLLRRLITVHILATAAASEFYGGEPNNPAIKRCARWLSVIKEANLRQIEHAEYLGWVAYNSGDYGGTANWLELSKEDTAAAAWLRAKLQRRAGRLGDAVTSMAKAWQIVRNTAAYTGWHAPAPIQGEEANYDLHSGWTFPQSATGDLGGLHLARGDFIQALDILLKGQLWEDAAYIAERVLTANELKDYVDQLQANPSDAGPESVAKLRYLLGRRLVREDRYAEAAHYLRAPYDKILEKYVEALQNGANDKLSKPERARALFTAAWLARYDGMELMGTEGAPDGFAENGSFEVPDIAQQRLSGVYRTFDYSGGDEHTAPSKPIVLQVSASERERLGRNKIIPNTRFHYRVIAGAVAMKAAALLPNQSEELADVVNHAGLWVKDRDEKLGNRYFQVLEQRCANTAIGRAARVKHWFVDQNGPWSSAQGQAYQALHKELHIESGDRE